MKTYDPVKLNGPWVFGSAQVGANIALAPSTGTPFVVSDTMHRIQIDSSTIVTCQFWDTNDVRDQLVASHDSLYKDIDALKVVVNWQRKSLNYQSVYNAYLIGLMTEEEFDKESDSYISEIKEAPIDQVAEVVQRLDRLLDFKLSEAELAEHLEVPLEAVEQAVNMLRVEQQPQANSHSALAPSAVQISS